MQLFGMINMKMRSDYQICSQRPEILQHRLRVPSFRLDSLEPAQMSSLLGRVELNHRIFLDAGEGHRSVAHDWIVFGQHHQSLHVQSIQFLIGYRVLIEDFLCRGIAHDFGCQIRMEFHQILRLFDLGHIDQSNLLPKLHLLMPEYSLLDISLHEEPLVYAAHFLHNLGDVDGRSQDHESLDVGWPLLAKQVAHEIVASEASAHQKDLGVGVVVSDSLEGGFQLPVLHGSEWHGAGHLIIDAAAIEADTAVPLLRGWPHEFLDVVHLAAAGESMHHEQNWRILLLDGRGEPVQRDVASVLEEDLLSFELEWKQGLADVEN